VGLRQPNESVNYALMRRPLFAGTVVLFALCWIAAGPGGLLMREVLGCPDPAMHHHHHGTTSGHGPCVCAGMVGVSDLAVSDTLPEASAGPVVSMPAVRPAERAVAAPHASVSLTPPTPPPNTRA